MAADTITIGNDLLRSLPDAEIGRLRPSLQPVTLVLQQVLHEAGSPTEHVYFPEGGLISLTADTGDLALVEVGMTGREGMVGSAALLTPDPVSVHRAIVQLPGTALRIRSAVFREAIAEMPILRGRCYDYLQFILVQTAQAAACNARHELTSRLARWLLMARERQDTDELPMRQEFLSYMLGVRRAGVSVVAGALQSAGLIRQSRGKLTITDRAGLEAQACSCYGLIRDSRIRLLGPSQGDV